MLTVNEKLLDRYIRHAVYIERFKTGEARKIAKHLDKEVFPELIDKLIDKLKKTDPSKLKKVWVIKRLKRLTASVDRIITVGMIKAENKVVKNLMDLAEWEARWNKNVIEKAIPLDIDMSMPSSEVLRQAVLTSPVEGHKLGTWFKGYKRSVRVGMMRAVRKGISAGEDLPSIGRRLRKVTSLKRMQAEYIARTAVSNVVHKARDAVYAQNTDLIKAVMYIATLDTRTTLICINLDRQTFPIAEGPRPPMHFNCRSTTVPVTASWKEFGIKDPPSATRASMTGTIPAKQSYKGWLRKQNKATQIKVLGKTRTELYRSGKVKIDRFVGKDYEPLTLKQLAKREKIIISRELKISPALLKKYKLEGVHKNYNEPLISEFVRLEKKFPITKKRFGGSELLPEKEYRRFTGKTGTAVVKNIKGKDKIFLNGKFFGTNSRYDTNAIMKRLAKKKFLVGDNVKTVATHEFGHIVANSLPKNIQDKLFDFYWEADVTGMRKIKSQISSYAAESYHELFAESFTQWQVDETSSMAKKVLRIAGFVK